MIKREKTHYMILVLVLCAAFVVMLGPLDIFSHGYFCDVVEYEDIYQDDILEYVDLSIQDYQLTFTPIKKHFAGFVVNLINDSEENTGTLFLTVSDSDGKKIDEIRVDVNKIISGKWYKVYANKSLNQNKQYRLSISAQNCSKTLQLQLVDTDYITSESKSDNLLIGYAYEDSTFTLQEKILISLLTFSFCGIICYFLIKDDAKKKLIKLMSLFTLLTTVLAWNYMYNYMDCQNTNFTGFQDDSETLVTGPIMAQKAEVDNASGFGLGRYSDVSGELYSYNQTFLTDDNWKEGYYNGNTGTAAAILVDKNNYTKNVAVIGNYVKFSNGDEFLISDVYDDGTWLSVYLQTDRILRKAKYGDLSDIVFLDANHTELPKGFLGSYQSQYGLQGKVFKYLSLYFSIDSLHLLCSLALAIVLLMIVFLMARKYNKLYAGVFFVTFFLSPWIVNFANDMYWVEFTWFLPMMVGLFCAWKVDERKCRSFSYVAAYVSITIKCLCGYEYISVVMMGLISFLLVDLISAIFMRNKERQKLLFRTTFIIGILALLGFATALCIHAPLKGDGSLIEGIERIIEDDVLRRTYGANLNDYDWYTGWEADALTASAWEVLCIYFHFQTEIITGISGNLFPLLCIIPIVIFTNDFQQKKLNVEIVSMYIVFFFTTVSWYILAKSHSYVHRHMNYVLWYFGFVQVCLYTIINKLAQKSKI